jgi:outer membrane protein assembly factor BamB
MKHAVAIVPAALIAGWIIGLLPACPAADWPAWRHDGGHSSTTSDELAAPLHLAWTLELPTPSPAWPASQPWLRDDASYSPVAAQGMLFVPSMVSDRVTAYDLATGREKWRFYADGPVRLAPLFDQGRLYFGSDDGYLYCLDATQGTLQWRVRGGPYDRKILGSGRLIGTWPVCGGALLFGGKLYFTAGLWPFMGIFVHAVDPRSGRAVWTNSGEGSAYGLQPHNSPSFSGFVPRGYLAATPQGLIAPGGRNQPGCYDLESGRLRYFEFGRKNTGAYDLIAHDSWYIVDGCMRRVADGKPIRDTAATIYDDQALYGLDGGELVAQSLHPERQAIATTGAPGGKKPKPGDAVRLLGKIPPATAGRQQLFLKAGSKFVLGDGRSVAVVRPASPPRSAEILWRETLDADPWTMLVADNRLVVVTTSGRISCYGPSPPKSTLKTAGNRHDEDHRPPLPAEFSPFRAALSSEGYALLLGLQSPDLAEQLVRGSRLQWIGIDADVPSVARWRRRMDDSGLYGRRFTAHVGDPVFDPLPPYLAELIIADSLPAAAERQSVALVRRVFGLLRPYGGKAFFRNLSGAALRRLVDQAGLAGAETQAAQSGSLLLRPQGPPGAADWTHQYADAANSVFSPDRLVRAPLGLLWFGGPSNDDVLPRHGHGPAPQVSQGRLFIEGPDMLRAIDIYTGRLLWQHSLPQLGAYYDHTDHQPGANEIGSNYASSQDRVYVVHGNAVLELDAADGRLRRQFPLPPGPEGGPVYGGFVAVWEDLLLAGVQPSRYASDSPRLMVIDRHSGRVLWQRQAQYAFRHNAIALGSGKVFAIDALPQSMFDAWKRRGEGPAPAKRPAAASNKVQPAPEKRPAAGSNKSESALESVARLLPGAAPKPPAGYQPRLLALDVRTGATCWSTAHEVFGTFLSYSAEFDALLEAGSAARDRAVDEADHGMAVYRGADGHVLWKDLRRPCAGPCILHHATIITQNTANGLRSFSLALATMPSKDIITQNMAYGLLSGEPKYRTDPLTGLRMPWQWHRKYGCNTAIGCENLLTFRSAAAGYYDLANDGGTGNLGGFKSGCTSNLIAAGGLLNAPDYTRTCTCRYQNQTSLALIHDPRVESWTFNAYPWTGARIRRVGINFGAPGDRMADGGTLWLDYPSQGGPSPDIPVQVEPAEAQYFRHHSALLRVVPGSGGLSWVGASGVRNVRRVTLTLAREDLATPRRYTVRLHFAEMDDAGPGERVFSVRLQERLVAPAVDIAREAGPRTALVKEFCGVAVTDNLRVALEPGAGSRRGPLLCGIEVVLEGEREVAMTNGESKMTKP